MQKGDIAESKSSRFFHRKGVPVLVSPLVLRAQNLGQIDVSYLEKRAEKTWVLKIIEMKSSLYPGRQQIFRLLKTQDYLSRVFEMEAKLEVKFCQKDDPPLTF